MSMSCRICLELESSLQSARKEVPPEILLGLTAAGERNRTQQKNEKVAKVESMLSKHKLICPDNVGNKAPVPALQEG